MPLVQGSATQASVIGGYVDLTTAQTVAGVKTFSTQIETPDGSAATPGIQIGTDADTGLYRDATKGVVTAVNGVDRFLTYAAGDAEISRGGIAGNLVLSLTNLAGTSGLRVFSSTPEAAVTGNPSDICFDRTNGRWYGKVTGTGNTGWREISPSESGTWAPTYTAVANIDTVSGGGGKYTRIKTGSVDIVTFSIRVNVDATAAGSARFTASLPVASNFTSALDAIGVLTSQALAAGNNLVQADTTNDVLDCLLNTSSTVSNIVVLSGMYQVL